MLKQIIDSLEDTFIKEKTDEMCDFLQKQELDEKLPTPLFIISKLYNKIPNLKLEFNENIKSNKSVVKLTYNLQQKLDLSVLSINITEQIINTIIDQAVIDIVEKVSKSDYSYITTDKHFFTFNDVKPVENDKFETSIVLNYRIILTKEMRKLKLNEINK